MTIMMPNVHLRSPSLTALVIRTRSTAVSASYQGRKSHSDTSGTLRKLQFFACPVQGHMSAMSRKLFILMASLWTCILSWHGWHSKEAATFYMPGPGTYICAVQEAVYTDGQSLDMDLTLTWLAMLGSCNYLVQAYYISLKHECPL